MRRSAPAGEEFTVRLVRGFGDELEEGAKRERSRLVRRGRRGRARDEKAIGRAVIEGAPLEIRPRLAVGPPKEVRVASRLDVGVSERRVFHRQAARHVHLRDEATPDDMETLRDAVVRLESMLTSHEAAVAGRADAPPPAPPRATLPPEMRLVHEALHRHRDARLAAAARRY